MAIRIRKINGHTVALCAAKTTGQKGDIYLDDATHGALATKFGWDWYHSGLIKEDVFETYLVELMIKEEE